MGAYDLEAMRAAAEGADNGVPTCRPIGEALIGELVGFRDETTPLVTYPGQAGTAALAARSIPLLRGEHVGRPVVLIFERSDPVRPIVLGCLQAPAALSVSDKPAHVEVDVDGKRLVVMAKEELVLRCGKASITLTRAGKVVIQGAYVSSRSSGVNRIKGGSVQIN